VVFAISLLAVEVSLHQNTLDIVDKASNSLSGLSIGLSWISCLAKKSSLSNNHLVCGKPLDWVQGVQVSSTYIHVVEFQEGRIGKHLRSDRLGAFVDLFAIKDLQNNGGVVRKSPAPNLLW